MQLSGMQLNGLTCTLYVVSWSTIHFPGWTIAATAHQPMWVVSQVWLSMASPSLPGTCS